MLLENTFQSNAEPVPTAESEAPKNEKQGVKAQSLANSTENMQTGDVDAAEVVESEVNQVDLGALKITTGLSLQPEAATVSQPENDDDISEEHMMMILAFCDLASCDFEEAKLKLKVS